MRIQRSWCLCLLGWLWTCVSQVSGGVIPVGNADWNGSRTQSAGEIIGVGNVWGGVNHEITLAYQVAQNGSTYTYTYTLSDYTSQGAGLSHFVITTSNGLNGTTAFTSNNVLAGTTGFGTNDLEVGILNAEQGFGAPSEPYGIKFDFGDELLGIPPTYVLVTDRAPIWGSFFAKAGGGATDGNRAFNVGWVETGYYLALDGQTFSPNDWIPVPDSRAMGEVPEPTSLAIFAGLGLGVGVVRRRRNIRHG